MLLRTQKSFIGKNALGCFIRGIATAGAKASFTPQITPCTPRSGAISNNLFTKTSTTRCDIERVARRTFATEWKIKRELMIPYPTTPSNRVPHTITKPDYAQKSKNEEEEELLEMDAPISIKDVEIEGVREACKIAKEVLQYSSSLVREGTTTDEIDRKVHDVIINKFSSYPSLLQFKGFPKSISTSINEVLINGVPDCRPLSKGDIITISVGIFHKGYHGSCASTFFVGDIEEDQFAKKLITIAKTATEEGIKQCRPTEQFSRIGEMIEFYVAETKYGIAQDFIGFGIGKGFQETPYVFHTENGMTQPMEAGMIFTIEPVITEGNGNKWVKWSDGFTIAARDKGRAAQFKHTVLVTPGGVEILT